MTTKWYQSLVPQIIILLTVALLPLGVIAVSQTNAVRQSTHDAARAALVTETNRATVEERRLIERAAATSSFIAQMGPILLETPGQCTEVMRQLIDSNPEFSLAGIMPTDGVMRCTSSGEGYDFSEEDGFADIMVNPEPIVGVLENGAISGVAVLFLMQPIEAGETFGGYANVSLPLSALPEAERTALAQGLVDVIAYDKDWTPLTSLLSPGTLGRNLPDPALFESVLPTQATTLRGETDDGTDRYFAITPVGDSPVTLVGVWDRQSALASQAVGIDRLDVFPWLMWLASLGVAMLAIHTLILRHIRTLRWQMDVFGRDRVTTDIPDETSMPTELRDLQRNFRTMAMAIEQDEGDMQAMIQQKNVLLKEVHHRVKNNLQLISSITNIERRNATEPETEAALTDLRARVLSFATLHDNIYEAGPNGLIDIPPLIDRTISNRVATIHDGMDPINVHTELAELSLYPVQAVPLSLLCAELVTDAINAASECDTPDAHVELQVEGRQCRLSVSWPQPKSTPEDRSVSETLVRAFTTEIGGKLERFEKDGQSVTQITFTALEAMDYGADF